ncbi:MAG: hypothetical protein V3R68_03185, partial [Gammaproteobacteria bacterium]
LILYKAASAHWMIRDLRNKPDPLFQALTVFMTTMAINIVLWPGLAYAQGLTTAGISIGLSACVWHKHQEQRLKARQTEVFPGNRELIYST